MKLVALRLVLAALVMVAQVTATEDTPINCDAPSSCAEDAPQVCGSDGVTYANRCSFESAFCADRSETLVIVSEGECSRAAVTPAPTTTASQEITDQENGLEPPPTEQGGSSTTDAVTPAPTVPSSSPTSGSQGSDSGVQNQPTDTPAPAETSSTPTEAPATSAPTEAPATSAPTEAPAEAATTVEVTMSGTVATKCNPICTKVYDPVCGSNGVTYANQCLFDYAACRDARVMKMHDGKCPKRSGNCVPEVCNAIFDPVCGSDGVTYDNDCMFHNAKCRLPKLVILHDGDCNEDTPLRCATLTCPQHTVCREDEDDEIAYCADVCAAERCSAPYECQLLDTECFTAPCSPVATCVPIQVEAES